MKIQPIPIGTANWTAELREEKCAPAGQAVWRTAQFDGARVRRIGLHPGNLPGMRYQVADNIQTHRSTSPQGAPLFIAD